MKKLNNYTAIVALVAVVAMFSMFYTPAGNITGEAVNLAPGNIYDAKAWEQGGYLHIDISANAEGKSVYNAYAVRDDGFTNTIKLEKQPDANCPGYYTLSEGKGYYYGKLKTTEHSTTKEFVYIDGVNYIDFKTNPIGLAL